MYPPSETPKLMDAHGRELINDARPYKVHDKDDDECPWKYRTSPVDSESTPHTVSSSAPSDCRLTLLLLSFAVCFLLFRQSSPTSPWRFECPLFRRQVISCLCRLAGITKWVTLSTCSS
jgi:hypothetical protein